MGWRQGCSSGRSARVLLFVLAGLSSAAREARAEPAQKDSAQRRSAAASSVAEKASSSALPRRWYGWQILVADGAASGLLLLDIASSKGEPEPALALLFFVSPILHAVHENPGGAAGSLGLRAVLPFVGALIGMGQSNCAFLGGARCKAMDVGAAIGFAGAVLMDASLLAWETDDAPASHALRLRPALEIGQRGGWLGVAGAL